MSFRVGHVVYDPDPSCAWNDLSAEFELFCRYCRLPTKPEALGEGVASATANLGLPRHVAGWLAASGMKGLESGLFFPGDFLEISWRCQAAAALAPNSKDQEIAAR